VDRIIKGDDFNHAELARTAKVVRQVLYRVYASDFECGSAPPTCADCSTRDEGNTNQSYGASAASHLRSPPNDLRVSGERKRVRCTRVLGSQPLDALNRTLVTTSWRHVLSSATGPNAVA